MKQVYRSVNSLEGLFRAVGQFCFRINSEWQRSGASTIRASCAMLVVRCSEPREVVTSPRHDIDWLFSVIAVALRGTSPEALRSRRRYSVNLPELRDIARKVEKNKQACANVKALGMRATSARALAMRQRDGLNGRAVRIVAKLDLQVCSSPVQFRAHRCCALEPGAVNNTAWGWCEQNEKGGVLEGEREKSKHEDANTNLTNCAEQRSPDTEPGFQWKFARVGMEQIRLKPRKTALALPS